VRGDIPNFGVRRQSESASADGTFLFAVNFRHAKGNASLSAKGRYASVAEALRRCRSRSAHEPPGRRNQTDRYVIAERSLRSEESLPDFTDGQKSQERFFTALPRRRFVQNDSPLACHGRLKDYQAKAPAKALFLLDTSISPSL